MTDRDKVDGAIGGGGTTGTRQPEPVSGVDRGAGMGQAGSGGVDDAELQQRERERHNGEPPRSETGENAESRDGFGGGEAGVEAATGEGSGTKASTGMRMSHSGRATTEGNAVRSGAPDAGSPGGMGGAGADNSNPENRPPGGVSPVEEDKK